MLIEELIPGKNLEDNLTEFKGIIEEGISDKGKIKENGWLKTFVAFANSEGGVIYIGVDNKTHEVKALDHNTTDKIILMIQRLVKQKINPSIQYQIATIPCPGTKPLRYVIKVSISKSKILPVTLHENGLLGIYVRNYGSTEIATPEMIRELILASDNVPFDQPFTDQDFRKEDFTKLYSLYKKRTGTDLNEKVLISIGFINPEMKLSAGSILFKDDYEGNKTRITATQWPELNKGSSIILASEDFKGNILDSIHFAIDFIQNHSINGFKKEATKRIDFFSYPARSITEGIINAIVHRNYFITGSQIEINMFKDRLEITSPGALLGIREINKETNISSIIPRRRNEVICAIMEKCRYMESKGSGFDKITEDYKPYGDVFKPFISASSTSFTLTLPNLTFKEGVIDEENNPDVYTIKTLKGKNDKKILSYCYAKQRTAKEIADYVKISDSTYFRKNVLDRLAEEGYLFKYNQGRTTLYLSNQDKVFIV